MSTGRKGKAAAREGGGADPSGMQFSGAMTALITPFKADGSIDWDAFGELIESQVAGGIEGVVPCGTTGESATMNHQEHHEVVRFTVKTVAGRAKVLAGTGSNATSEAVGLTRAAAEAGADGSLQVAPYYNKPTQEGLYRHFKAIGEATGGFPQVLYNIPGRCGVEIAVDTVARLAELPFVVGIKEAGGSLDRVSSLLAACSICLVSGDDSLTVPMMSVGGRGVISVISNLFPADVKCLVDAAASGDFETARQLHYRMLPVVRLLFAENNPMGIKTAMRLAGKPSGAFRPPLCEMRPENVAKLEKALANYNMG
jgi:4-hydroxy-tetrahydrodipicolinate synthase